jgi:hypothetical protein
MNISFFDDKPNLDELDFKDDFIYRYKNINVDEMSNLLFYGLPHCGKTIKIYALLCSIFNKKVYDLKNMVFEEDRKTMNYKSSIYHIEINPLTLGSNEKLFINSFLKIYIETRNVGLDIPKIILIKNADHLSTNSQMAFRKFMEKNYKTCKFIFEVNNLSNFLEPLKSRCLLFRVKMPLIHDIKLCLKNMSVRKNIVISDDTINEIINNANKLSLLIDLKKIFGFYTYYIFTNKHFSYLYYEKFNEIINYINNKKISFVIIQKIRDLIGEMYINLVPMEELILFIYTQLSKIYIGNDLFLHNLLLMTNKCYSNIQNGNKDTIHIEYYIICIIELVQTIINN